MTSTTVSRHPEFVRLIDAQVEEMRQCVYDMGYHLPDDIVSMIFGFARDQDCSLECGNREDHIVHYPVGYFGWYDTVMRQPVCGRCHQRELNTFMRYSNLPLDNYDITDLNENSE